MKKMLLSLSACIFIATIILAPTGKASAASEVDQQHIAGSGSVSIDESLGRFAQIFMPTKSKLDKVEIELANVSGTKTVDVAIRHRVGTTWDTGNLTTISAQTVTTGWNTFDFNDLTLTLSSNDTYGIFVSANQNGPQWKYKSGPSVYDRGYAIWQNNDKIDWDYNFKTYGYESSVESSDDTSDESTVTSTSSSQDTSTGDSPAEATSTTIKAPSAAKAVYSTSDSIVKITWTKSTTTDVDGYKVYRSEKKTKGFKEIGETNATTLEYTDSQGLTSGKSFYYQVRAYKGTDQSPSSNVVELLVPEIANTINASDVAEVKNNSNTPVETAQVEEITLRELELYWVLGGVAAILFVLLCQVSVFLDMFSKRCCL